MNCKEEALYGLWEAFMWHFQWAHLVVFLLPLSSMIRIGSFSQLFFNPYLYCTSLILTKPRTFLQSSVYIKG